jgi:hypothetical protein
VTGAGFAAAVAAAAPLLLALGMQPVQAGLEEALPASATTLATADAVPVSLETGPVGPIDPLALEVPLAHARLERSPSRSEAAAGISDIRQAHRDVPITPVTVLGVTSSNPPDGARASARSLGPPGPNAVAETPSPTLARSGARLGLAVGGLLGSAELSVGVARADTDVEVDARRTVAGRAVSEAVSLDVAGIHVGGVRSTIEVSAPATGPPLVTYRMTITEPAAGEGGLVPGAEATILMEGAGIPLVDLPDQFSREARRSAATLQSPALEGRLRLLNPRVERDRGHVTVTAPVLDVAVSRDEDSQLRVRFGAATVSTAVGGSGEVDTGVVVPSPSRAPAPPSPPVQGLGTERPPPGGVPSSALVRPATPKGRVRLDLGGRARPGQHRGASRLVTLVVMGAILGAWR